MELKELRQILGMSQRQFASVTGIPLGTLRNWEQGLSEPPEYVYKMVINAIRRDMMINVETVKFVKMLEELAELMEGGIAEFAEATETNRHEKLFYDASTRDEKGRCRIVLDSCVVDDPECRHHDVVSYYEDYINGKYTVRAVLEGEDADAPYLEVRVDQNEELIIVEPGHWYFS